MVELGSHGFQETDAHLLCYFDKTALDKQQLDRLKHDVKELLKTISANAEVRLREFEEENWNSEWEKTIQPIEVGQKFVIKPSWSSYENKENRIVIQIDPKMSFGTGYHETTRLVLRLLERYLVKNSTPQPPSLGFQEKGVSRPQAGRGMSSVLDVGTGTGILAIAAIKLGAKSALGVDIDDWSIENANENIVANGVEQQIKISDLPITSISGQIFDAITANLTLNTNLELLPVFHRLLAPNGMVFLSGLLESDREAILRGLVSERFRITEELRENEWIAVAATKANA